VETFLPIGNDCDQSGVSFLITFLYMMADLDMLDGTILVARD